MYSLDDTIAAISTPIGEGGIGIVRMSGPEALAILQKIFVKGKPTNIQYPISNFQLHYGHIIDPETAEVIDEVLVSYMKAPRTYTRQDVAEINCHGGIAPLRRTLELCLRQGARLASPGEFTLRWLDINESQWGKESSMQGGAPVEITSPGEGQWMVVLLASH